YFFGRESQALDERVENVTAALMKQKKVNHAGINAFGVEQFFDLDRHRRGGEVEHRASIHLQLAGIVVKRFAFVPARGKQKPLGRPCSVRSTVEQSHGSRVTEQQHGVLVGRIQNLGIRIGRKKQASVQSVGLHEALCHGK